MGNTCILVFSHHVKVVLQMGNTLSLLIDVSMPIDMRHISVFVVGVKLETSIS